MYGYIYLIVNKVNGKTYVGQHKSSNWRDKYMGSGRLLHDAKKKYGKENFEKFLIQYCETKEELDKQEIFWIAEYRSRGKAEYNISKGGGGYNLSGKFTIEHRKKLSEAKIGKAPWNKGMHLSDEQKRHLSEYFKEHPTRGSLGYHHTKEAIERNRQAHLGVKQSKETRLKRSESLKGIPRTDEWKSNISKANKGRHYYNNGKVNVMRFECPEGFVPGRI